MLRQPEVVVGDITTLEVDAIVNAANEQLVAGGGVCGAIFKAAGGAALGEACRALAPCAVGDARITAGFDLPARYVIHSVGPRYGQGGPEPAEQLRSCYQRSLETARDHQVSSIAFPCLSTGIFGYPIEEATPIALRVLKSWLLDRDVRPRRVICCCFSERDAEVYRRTLLVKGEQD